MVARSLFYHMQKTVRAYLEKTPRNLKISRHLDYGIFFGPRFLELVNVRHNFDPSLWQVSAFLERV